MDVPVGVTVSVIEPRFYQVVEVPAGRQGTGVCPTRSRRHRWCRTANRRVGGRAVIRRPPRRAQLVQAALQGGDIGGSQPAPLPTLHRLARAAHHQVQAVGAGRVACNASTRTRWRPGPPRSAGRVRLPRRAHHRRRLGRASGTPTVVDRRSGAAPRPATTWCPCTRRHVGRAARPCGAGRRRRSDATWVRRVRRRWRRATSGLRKRLGATAMAAVHSAA